VVFWRNLIAALSRRRSDNQDGQAVNNPKHGKNKAAPYDGLILDFPQGPLPKPFHPTILPRPPNRSATASGFAF
jgi:hypothetical protein